jgi:DNA invertase Pin-like site-specific DNA recombinase
MSKKFVAYYRVSTQKQGQSVLGLEAQRFAVESYVHSVGGKIEAEFEETDGNKDTISVHHQLTIEMLLRKRPKLLEAIQRAQRENLTVVVKQPSHLTRFSLLMDYFIAIGLQFVCADSPNDNAMIIKLKTAIKEEELLKISERTTRALAALKARGHQLGNPRADLLTKPEVIAKSVTKRKEIAAANENNRRAAALIKLHRQQGLTWSDIASMLNADGFRTSRGKQFQAVQVQRIHQRKQ